MRWRSLRLGLQHLRSRSEYKAAASCRGSWGGGGWRWEVMKGEGKVPDAPPTQHTQSRVLGSSLRPEGSVACWSLRTEKKGCMGYCVHFERKTVLFLSSLGGWGALVEQTRSSGWWDWSCGVIPPVGRGWSSEQVSFNFRGEGAGPAACTWAGPGQPQVLGWGGCHAWGSPGWVGLGVPGFWAPSDCSLKSSSWAGRAGAGHRCTSGGGSRWWSRSLCRAGHPVLPPPGVSQTESRSCQALRRVKRGRTDCAILEPG